MIGSIKREIEDRTQQPNESAIEIRGGSED